jgi:hypothetical protein
MMPKKNSLDIPQANILMEDEEPEQIQEEIPPPQAILIKPKRQVSDAQREHLNKIRAKALEKKAEMKEDALKAKLAKTIEKKELAKKYDDYTQENEKEKEQEIKKKLNQQRKKRKKYINELIHHHLHLMMKSCLCKENKRYKKQLYHKKESEDSLDSTLYISSQEILHKRAKEERVEANLIRWNNAMMPQEY